VKGGEHAQNRHTARGDREDSGHLSPGGEPAHNSHTAPIASEDSGHLSEPRLFTASWTVALDGEPAVAPVRISLGKPRWISPAQADRYPAIRLLMPIGLLGLDLDRDDFEARYIERIERYSTPIAETLNAMLNRTDKPILMACFEDLMKPDQWCHRTMAARWIEQRLGLQVPEWEPESGRRDTPQMTLTDDPEGG
jgi:hypothetical protein